MLIMTLRANVACGTDPSVTSNPASYPFSLQPAFFVESSFVFCREFDIGHHDDVQMSHGSSNTRLFFSADCCAVCRGHTVCVSTVSTVYQGHAEPKLVLHLHYATS
jgi:hypothetical protein